MYKNLNFFAFLNVTIIKSKPSMALELFFLVLRGRNCKEMASKSCLDDYFLYWESPKMQLFNVSGMTVSP